jgi:hypothetical protein
MQFSANKKKETEIKKYAMVDKETHVMRDEKHTFDSGQRR